MDTQQSVSEIKKAYTGAGFVIIGETDEAIVFGVTKSGKVKFDVSKAEINNFAACYDLISKIKAGQKETAAVGEDFYEQAIESASEGRLAYIGDRQYRFGTGEVGQITAYIGPASEEYVNFFRLNLNAVNSVIDRTERLGATRTQNIGDALSRTLTFRIEGVGGLIASNDVDDIIDMANNCLFELSYLKARHFELREQWIKSIFRQRLFSPRRMLVGNEFPLRDIKYDQVIARFYKRAMSSSDAYIQFISFYHVLEYFFVSVTDDILYERIKRIAKDPAFRANRRNMDKIITSVEEHRRTSDESEMLKNVLNRYVEDQELIEFIVLYEKEFAKTYTEKSQCFGLVLDKIVLTVGHVAGPLAKRIKSIRNALVHSSDRYERNDRYVPGPDANRILRRELPLLRFIAEKVIIASAEAN